MGDTNLFRKYAEIPPGTLDYLPLCGIPASGRLFNLWLKNREEPNWLKRQQHMGYEDHYILNRHPMMIAARNPSL